MNHAEKAAAFIANEARTNWHDQALWFVREKRDKLSHGIPEWEGLRELASQIKAHTLSDLDTYLQQFEKNALSNGVQVHWAADAEEHNQVVFNILQKRCARRLVKSKSMLTEECGLNPFLEKKGIEVVDTDLGERIIQLKKEAPSHIVMPAIHLKKEEVGDLFHEKLNTKKGAADPNYLTEAARRHLRSEFLRTDAALTGVNFAVAETGAVVVCTNEGNADMGVHLASLQIHSMGLEKIIPRQADLAVFIRLLARSATGQPITIYTAQYRRPRAGAEMHIVIVDNGRSEHLGRPEFRSSLKCIRCGACMNTCPVYRRSGGHSYGSIIPGPIGSILSPGKDLKKHGDLPFASTLCGSCTDVCPVKIDIHEQLYRWRKVVVEKGDFPKSTSFRMKIAGAILSKPTAYRWAGKMARWSLGILPRFLLYNRLNVWGKERELPQAPKKSFKEWYKINSQCFRQNKPTDSFLKDE